MEDAGAVAGPAPAGGAAVAFDPNMETDLHAVARAYRAVREAGDLDDPAYRAAFRVYCVIHPGAETDLTASRRVAMLIKPASQKGLLWPLAPGWRGGNPAP